MNALVYIWCLFNTVAIAYGFWVQKEGFHLIRDVIKLFDTHIDQHTRRGL